MGSQAFIDSKQAVAKAKECANAALEIDSEIAEAHATMGFIFTVSLQFGRAEQEFQRAIGLNPNYATARYFYSVHKTFVGDFDGALTEVMKARSLDPYSLQVNEYLAFVYYLTGDYERAIEQSKTALEIESGAITSHGWMALSYAEMGEFDKAIHEAEIAYKTGHPYGPGYLGYVYAKAGMKSEAIEVIRRVEEEEAEKKRNVDHGIIAMIYSCLAQYDGAFQELEQALKHGSMLLPALSSYPWFANLTHDQRFKILQAKLGLASL
jgi:tetratricopeptide (TPR) repeat protein